MPIYDYQCSSCGFKAEVMRKISAPHVEVCPECATESFSKQLSAPSFQLSGSGWYATDFKNSGSGSTAKPATSATSDSATSSGSTVEKTSENKSEPASSACSTGCACH